MRWWHILFLPAVFYQILSIAAIVRYKKSRAKTHSSNGHLPSVSVLKPVLGLDPNTCEAFRSQADQDYPEFEVLFGVRNPNDPVIPAIENLRREFPAVPIRLIQSRTEAPNGKVGSLIDLGREAHHPVWVINDGDIAVTSSYLRDIVAPLGDPSIGVVTCPYRAIGHSIATRWEALGITTDFIPSTMVAQLIGVRDFGLGSTLAFHAKDLRAAGGFEALANYIADDFQLAHRITATGKRALLSQYVVETSLGESKWSGVWRHQVRWARTIRMSKGVGYAGLPIAHAGLWALLAAVCGAWPISFMLVSLRFVGAALSVFALRDRQTIRIAWLAPLWDVFAFLIWVTAWSGNRVRWRNRELRLGAGGVISEETALSDDSD